MLLYSLLHLSGFDLPLAELKIFDNCTRRPRGIENTLTVGVETTTGPLGQGVARSRDGAR